MVNGGVTVRLDVMKIVRLLAEQGLTKSELAARSGVSRQQISTINLVSAQVPNLASPLVGMISPKSWGMYDDPLLYDGFPKWESEGW